MVNEPQGSPTWYPVNDTLKDKATYDFLITLPKDRTAMGNGVLVSKKDNGDTFTWHWRESVPMASYLATVTNGVFETRFGQLSSGVPQYDAVDPQTRRFGQKNPEPDLAWSRLAVEPEAVSFLSGLYGPYPFDSVGGIVDWAPNVFYSLESITKPNYWVIPSTATSVAQFSATTITRSPARTPRVRSSSASCLRPCSSSRQVHSPRASERAGVPPRIPAQRAGIWSTRPGEVKSAQRLR